MCDGIPLCPLHGDIFWTAAHLLIGLHGSGLGCHDVACLDLESGVCAIYNLLQLHDVEDYRGWIEALVLFRGK